MQDTTITKEYIIGTALGWVWAFHYDSASQAWAQYVTSDIDMDDLVAISKYELRKWCEKEKIYALRPTGLASVYQIIRIKQ